MVMLMLFMSCRLRRVLSSYVALYFYDVYCSPSVCLLICVIRVVLRRVGVRRNVCRVVVRTSMLYIVIVIVCFRRCRVLC